MTKAIHLVHTLISTADLVVRLKTTSLREKVRKKVCIELHCKEFEETEQKLIESLAKMFRDQIRSAISEVRKLSTSDSDELTTEERVALVAARDSGQIFDPKEWDEELVDRTLPILAIAMSDSILSTLAELGVAPKSLFEKMLDVEWNNPSLIQKNNGAKETTASAWLADQSGTIELPSVLSETDGGYIATEWPDWMKDSIEENLSEVYSQDFWAEVNKTTSGDINKSISKGLAEGWSIKKMAKEMSGSLSEKGKYAKTRATLIARTETGHALNAARSSGINQLKTDLGDVGSFIKRSWLSVLAATTRDDHADADGQIEDDKGMFNLGGYKVPWPSHYTLPPGQRCNCMCTVTTEFGIKPDNFNLPICGMTKSGSEKQTSELCMIPDGETSGSVERQGHAPKPGEQELAPDRDALPEEEYKVSEETKKWAKDLSDDAEMGFFVYSGMAHRRFRDCISLGIDCTEGIHTYTSAMKGAMKTAPKFKNKTYRGMSFDKEDDYVKFMAGIEKGGKFTSKSFMSTALTTRITDEFMKGPNKIRMHIDSVSGVDFAPVSKYTEQREILFAPETPFKVMQIKKNDEGVTEIFVKEMIEDG